MNRTLSRNTYQNEYGGVLSASLSIPVWIREYTNLSSLNSQIVSDNAEGAVTYTVHSAPPGFGFDEDGKITGTCGKFHTGFIDITAEDEAGKTARIARQIKCWPYALVELDGWGATGSGWDPSLGIILLDPNGPVRGRAAVGENHSLQNLIGPNSAIGALMSVTDLPPNLATASPLTFLHKSGGYTDYFFLREDGNGKRYIDYTDSRGRIEGQIGGDSARGPLWTVMAVVKDVSSADSTARRIITTAQMNTSGSFIDSNCAGYYGGCISDGDGWTGGAIMMRRNHLGKSLLVTSAGAGHFTEIGPGGSVIGTTYSWGHAFNGYYGSVQPSSSYVTLGADPTLVTVTCNKATGIGVYHKVAVTDTYDDFMSFNSNTVGYTGVTSTGVANRSYNLGNGIGQGGEYSNANYTGIALGDATVPSDRNYSIALYGLIAIPANMSPTAGQNVTGRAGLDKEKFEISQYFMQQMVSATPDFTINWPSIT